MIAVKKDVRRDTGGAFGPQRPLIDAHLESRALRKGLERYVEGVETALSAQPEPGVHHSLHDIAESRRLALGGLGMCLPDIILILESDPEDAVARKALALLSGHGTSDSIQLAAKVLLARTRPEDGPSAPADADGHDGRGGGSP